MNIYKQFIVIYDTMKVWRTFILERRSEGSVWSWHRSTAPDGYEAPFENMPISTQERTSAKSFPYEEDPL